MLHYGPNVLRAPAIDYQHPADETSTPLGRFRANGPGSLHYLPDPAKPTQVLEATWQRSVELGREHGQPVLLMEGRPRAAMTNMGTLAADRIKLYLRELQGAALAAGVGISRSGGSDSKGNVQLVPDRLIAAGGVEIQSSQLTGRTEELVTAFRMQSDVTAPAQAPVDSQAASGPVRQLNANPQPGDTQQTFNLDAQRIRMEVYLRGQSILPSSVVCEGNVVLREVPLTNSGEQPLEIRGDQLTIDQLESGTAHIVLTGARPGEAPGSKKAQLTGRGTTVLTEVVELDQRGNRLWSNGPGEATLILTRGLNSSAPHSAIPVDVSWKGGLQFDGQNVLIEKNVVVAGVDDTLSCDQLSVKLNVPIQFGQSVQQRTVDVAEIECRGHVSIDHRSRDDVGVTSHERILLERIAINQQTGAVSGDGPGVIRSTRYGSGLATLAGPQTGISQQKTEQPRNTSGSKLHFLRIEFQRELAGNIYAREISFAGRVRTVYGPVDAWEQELDATRLEVLPPETVLLSCDKLSINEDPIAVAVAPNAREADRRPLGPVQLEAKGNVRIDGHSESQGTFGAVADRATYEQVKDVFVLEGGLRTPAQLWLQRYPGEQVAPLSAGRIRYDRTTGLPKVERFQHFEITPRNLENADRPRPAPR
jgi:phage gp45-like